MAIFCPSCSKEITPEITQCPWCAYQFEPETIDLMSDIEDMSQEDAQKRREHVRISQSFKVSYTSQQSFNTLTINHLDLLLPLLTQP